MRPSTDPLSNRRAAASGLTLVELLVSILIGGFVSAGLTAMLNAEFRSSSAILRYQRSARHAAHARRFIESEAATATRLGQVVENGQPVNKLQLFGVHPGTTTSYTITYDVVAASSANQAGSVLRGPYVLRRVGPAYLGPSDPRAGMLDPQSASQSQTSVILDGLASSSAFQVNANGSSLGAALTLSMDTAGASYEPNFFITVATSPALGVLQLPKESFVSNCGNPVVTGCRNITITDLGVNKTVQEWDTRNLPGTTITAQGSPDEVIVYFNTNRPTTANSIRRTSTVNTDTCNRTSCYVIADRNYQINNRVDRLVFRDGVVGVQAN
jgi:Tfp pilus assembly protein PilV